MVIDTGLLDWAFDHELTDASLRTYDGYTVILIRVVMVPLLQCVGPNLYHCQ